MQIFDLSARAAALKQHNDTIEVYFSKLNTIWKEIDWCMPNLMICAKDITIFNNFIQRQSVYQFFAGTHEDLDKERKDLSNQEALPNLDMAYATTRREISRRGIIRTSSSLGLGPSEIGKGLAINYRSESSSRHDEGDRSHLRCNHCGGTRNTKEGCFKLVRYPEWWDDHKKGKATAKNPMVSRAGGKAHLASGFLTHHDSFSPEPSQGDQGLFLTNINGGEQVECCYRENRERDEEEKGESDRSQGNHSTLLPFYTPFSQNPNINPTSVNVHPDTQAHTSTNPPIKNENKGVDYFVNLFHLNGSLTVVTQ